MDSTAHAKLAQIRNELKNIRTQQTAMKMSFKQEMQKLERTLCDINELRSPSQNLFQPEVSNVRQNNKTSVNGGYHFDPIGYIESMYKHKNGTPRQPGICELGSCKLSISRERFSNPHHLLAGLEEFSHVWLIFVFHKNRSGFNGTKVKPPRLDGTKVGVFASRCPYRPNHLGLTLARIDKIEGGTVHLLGTDLVDGTPVLDIKPFIPEYDSVKSAGQCGLKQLTGDLTPSQPLTSATTSLENVESGNTHTVETVDPGEYFGLPADSDLNVGVETELLRSSGLVSIDAEDIVREQLDLLNLREDHDVHRTVDNIGFGLVGDRNESANLTTSGTAGQTTRVANWITNPPVKKLTVLFTPRAVDELEKFSCLANDPRYKLDSFRTCEELKSALVSVLGEDPRSIYRRKKCPDRLYYMTFDVVHVSCWFDDDTVEVVKIQPCSG